MSVIVRSDSSGSLFKVSIKTIKNDTASSYQRSRFDLESQG